MTSERRAQIIVVTLTIAAICAYGKNVAAWTPQEVFGVVGAGAVALVAGMTKSPREGQISDATTGQIVSAQSTTQIETQKEVKSATNPGPTVDVGAAAVE